MKKITLISICAIFIAVSFHNAQVSRQNIEMSDLAKANVDALQSIHTIEYEEK